MPYLVRGGRELLAPVLEHLGVAAGDRDTVIIDCMRFGVDDARALASRASSKALTASHRTFIIVAADITREAQNALLKTLEEPPANALFVFIVPTPETLIPTVRSRMNSIQLMADRSSLTKTEKDFITATPQKRLDMLKPLLETDGDTPRDIGAILAFLGSLERACGAKNPSGLAAIYRARKYATDSGALHKPLLEQLALLIPSP